jgi:transposase
MSQGYSIVGAAGKLGIGRTTIYDWQHQFPEFKLLIDKAKAARQAHWEAEALETQSGARVTMITKALAGMRSQDWSEDKRVEIELNSNVNHTLKIDQLSAEQLESLALMFAPKADDSLLIEHEE